MNATTDSETRAMALADIIDFKWLLAADGLHVHVERLQDDPVYARHCLDRADASSREVVRAAAVRLRRRLNLG